MTVNSMNLLLVDDEEYVIESIRQNIDFVQGNIEAVYTAFSMKQAQNLMEILPIDIIISDIVMPQGSGFDFIEWVRKQNYEVQVIFLTSYAEFDYARKAIALDSVDYLLKPIDYDKLREAIALAAQKVIRARQYEDYRRENVRFRQSMAILKQNFWQEVLKGHITEEKFEAEAEKFHLPYQNSDPFLFVCLVFHNEKSDNILWDGRTMGFIVCNVLSELMEGTGAYAETAFSMEPGCCAVICGRRESQTAKSDFDLQNHEPFDRFVTWVSEHMQLNLWCGVGTPCCGAHLRQSLLLVQKMRDNSLSVWNRALFLADFDDPKSFYQNPNLNVWEVLLEQEKEAELIHNMRQYLDEMEQKEMITRQILKSFRMDITQLVYSWLAQKEIKAHLLFSEKEDETSYQNAIKGMHGAIEYAVALVSKAIQYQKYVHRTASVTEQIKNYIDTHYMEEIRRDDLAEIVFLNTDYMARIFKKETGTSITLYLLQKRVEEAKKLLAQSALPINTVSIYVGYSNFSYFTKMFKENTGYSPLEYRRKAKKEKTMPE